MDIKGMLRTLLICGLFPLVVNYFCYFGYVSAYTKDTFSPDTFVKQYNDGIYKYRVLGKTLFLEFQQRLFNNPPKKSRFDDMVKFMDPEGDVEFYKAFFVFNTIFLILTAFLLYKVLNKIASNKQTNLLVVMGVVLLIGVTQFVITPYDTLAYALNLLAAYLILELSEKRRWWVAIALFLVTFLAALTRESAALILSFMAALTICKFSRNDGIYHLITLSVMVLIFIATYVGLRVVLGFEDAVFDSASLMIFNNFSSLKGLIGVFYFFVMCSILLVMMPQKNALPVMVLFIFALPYVGMCLFTGSLFEVRLWNPLFLFIIVFCCNNRFTWANGWKQMLGLWVRKGQKIQTIP